LRKELININLEINFQCERGLCVIYCGSISQSTTGSLLILLMVMTCHSVWWCCHVQLRQCIGR